MMKFDPTKVNANLPHQNTIFMWEMRPISSKHIRFFYATNSLSRLDFIGFVHYATMKIGICRKVIALGTTPRSIISVFMLGLQITAARHLTTNCTGQNVILFNPKYRVAHELIYRGKLLCCLSVVRKIIEGALIAALSHHRFSLAISFFI